MIKKFICGKCGFFGTRKDLRKHLREEHLIKREVHDKVKYFPTRLSKHGFREEQIFSYNAQMAGFKIGVDTGAINYHQLTPSGGERFPDQVDLVKFNQNILVEFTKEHKDELNKLFTHDNMPTELNLKRENNLLLK